MSDLHVELQPAQPIEPIDHFQGFAQGQMGAFRHFYRKSSYCFFVYLLRQTRDRKRSMELNKLSFLVLFCNHKLIKDEAHMLRVLYILSRHSLLLELTEPDTLQALEEIWQKTAKDEEGIMDDPAVIANESLHVVQRALLQLSRDKRKLAELYFFQGMSVIEIALKLGIEEAVIKEQLSELVKKLGEDPDGKKRLIE
jgi:RNA polymerase sigma factor (sigma-70 family)